MSDVVPLWGQVSRLQGRFDTAACQKAIREYAQHSDLDNVNVPASLIPLITKLISAEPDGVMADIACGRGLVMERSLMEDTGLSGEAVDINSRKVHFAEMLLSPLKFQTTPVEMHIDKETLNREFEVMTDQITDEERNFIVKKTSAEALFTAPNRIRKVCEHIVDHYRKQIEPTHMKCQIVVFNRANCVAYKKELDTLLGTTDATRADQFEIESNP